MKNNMLGIFFYVIMASLVTVLMSPEILMASDSVKITGLDASKIMKAVVVEPEVDDVAGSTSAQVALAVSSPKAGVAETVLVTRTQPVQETRSVQTKQPAKTKQTALVNSVGFSWGVQELFKASSTNVNSGAKVARVGRLIWGHNYTAFGNITKLGIGAMFTVTEGGTTTTYRVAANPLDGKAGVVLDKKDDSTLSYPGNAKYSSIKMNALTDMGFGGHSLVLMTCYGSNSRYVVVADAV